MYDAIQNNKKIFTGLKVSIRRQDWKHLVFPVRNYRNN